MIKENIGIVINNKASKTISVQVESKYQHKKYLKILKKYKKYLVHDETNSCKIGDIVLFKQVAPISARKHWILIKILKQNNL